MTFVGKFIYFLRSKKILIPLGILLVFYLIFLRGGADVSKIETVKVQKKDIRSEVTASGKVSAQNETSLKFAVGGRVTSVNVKEGDVVSRGQVIATLDREKYEIALRQANQDVVAADAELEKVYDGVKKDDFETFDEKISRTAAEAKKNKSFDNLKAAQRALRDTVLVAPISGTVVSLNIKPLEEVQVTTDVGKIIDSSAGVVFKSEVDETEISKVSVGQKAKLVLDAFEDSGIDSEVVKISDTSVTTSTGATAYEVELSFPLIGQYKVGMNGESRIITDESDNTLVVPFDVLVDNDFVWILRGDRYEKIRILKGLESDLEFEVKGGLAEGDEIVKSGFAEIEKKNLLQKLTKR